MKTGDLIGVAVLAVLLPAFVGYLVWLLRVRPRRQLRDLQARTEQVGRALGLAVSEPGLAGGTREGLSVDIKFSVTSTPYARGGRPVTICRAWHAGPFPISFVVARPRRYAAGLSRRWAGDVWIGGPNDEALALASSLAPLLEARAPAAVGALSLELDRATCSVLFDGYVVDPGRLEQGLALATELAVEVARGRARRQA